MTTLDRLDELTHAGNKVAFEWGWVANEYIAEVAEQEASVPFRTVLTESLDILAQRYSAYMVKNTLTDRVKVTRFFTREHVAEIPGHPTFNHLRACFVMGEWPDADEDATLQRVGWAVENGWPSPDVIRQQFGNGSKLQNEKEIKNLERAAMCVRDNPAHPIMVRDSAANCIMAIQGSVKLSEPDEFIKLSIEQALKLLAGNADDVLDYISGTLSEVEQPELLEAE